MKTNTVHDWFLLFSVNVLVPQFIVPMLIATLTRYNLYKCIMYIHTYIHTYIYTYIHTCTVPLPTLNIHTPGIPILLVCVILRMIGVSDPGIVIELTPSPALIPARASVPLSPLYPPDLSPVVHCILPSAYRNITNDSTPLVASTH